MQFREYIANATLKQGVLWAASILNNLFTVPPATESQLQAHHETEKFWSPEYPLFQWLERHGIKYDPSQGVPHFSQGGAGRAYFVGRYVVKMSANRIEANVAKMVAQRYDLPTVIIDVLPLSGGFYAILQHYVDEPPQEIKDGADYLTLVIDENPKLERFPEDKKEQELLCRQALEEFEGGSPSVIPYMMLMMDILNKLYLATGFMHDDAGPTNIGTYRGKIVIPDLGPNEPKDFSTEKAMRKIDQNRKRLGLSPHDWI